MNDKAKYWIELAVYDLETAEWMLKGKRYLYVGFMCHQTIEKALKSIISEQGETPPKIHRLARLAQLGNCYDAMTESDKDFLDILDPLNVASRYPEYKEKVSMALSHETCNDILRKTGDLLCWIKKRL